MATASAVTNVFSAPGALMDENFADVLDARFAFVKQRAWETPIQGLKYWNVRDTDRSYEKHSYVTDVGTMPKSRDVDVMPLTEKIQGFDNTYTPETYRLAIRVEQRLRETDMFGVIDRMMSDLNQSAKDTIELYAALPFNTAFAATVEWICADGMNLIDKDRPSEDPTQANWDNEDTSSTLTADAVSTMRVDFAKHKNGRGRIRPIRMEKIVIPIDLESTAIEELGSALKPGSSLNNKNALTEYNLNYEVWNYLTSTAFWYGMGPKDDLYELFWYWGVRPQTGDDETGNPNVWGKYLRQVFVTGADKPSSLRGNQGA